MKKTVLQKLKIQKRLLNLKCSSDYCDVAGNGEDCINCAC